MFVARQSNHIQEDIARNWSSWNFGQEGFSGSMDELIIGLKKAKDIESSFWISGFDIWVESVDINYNKRVVYVNDHVIRELYSDYWVSVDDVNARNGLSAISLNATSLNDAIDEANNRKDYWGDGISFDASESVLVYSNDDIHIFQINE
mgnify:FL=1